MSVRTEFRVNKYIWESFEAALEGAGKKFVRDIAGTLEVSPDELIKSIFNKNNKISVCLHDWNDESALCIRTLQQGFIVIPCSNAKMCGKDICRECYMKNPGNISTFYQQQDFSELNQVNFLEIEMELENDNSTQNTLDKNIVISEKNTRGLLKNKLWIDSNNIIYDENKPVGEYDEDKEEIYMWN